MNQADNRAPGVIWRLRDDLDAHVYILRGGLIAIHYDPGGDGHVTSLALSRRDARLLAKRINQCLDDTRLR
jgi:hypothetical protein